MDRANQSPSQKIREEDERHVVTDGSRIFIIKVAENYKQMQVCSVVVQELHGHMVSQRAIPVE